MKQSSLKTIILNLAIVLFALSDLSGQNNMWLSIDKELNAEFARAFMNVVDNSDMELGDDDNIPADKIHLKVMLNEDNPDEPPFIFVKRINQSTAINAFHTGPKGSLDRELLKKVNKNIISKILKRKYEWDHLSNEQAKIHKYRTRTAFKVADYKEVRDYFWWTRLKFKWNPINKQ